MSKYLDDLRAAAEAEFAERKNAEQQTVAEPNRAPVETPAPAESAEPIAPEQQHVEEVEALPTVVEETPVEQRPARRTVYVKTIDLGDGSAPQTFKASTKDELIEKILKAQENASRRINELKKENKSLKEKVQPDPATPERKYEPRQLSQEEELEISNELQTNPTGAIAKALRASLGADLEEVRSIMQEVRALRQRESIREIGQQFIAAHPEYPITPQNEKMMAEYIQKNNLGWTFKNLELAFDELTEAGLIQPIVNDEHSNTSSVLEELEEEVPAQPVEQAPKPAPVAPVVPTKVDTGLVEVPRRRRTVVGVSSSQAVATATPETPREVSVEDLLKMSPDQRRRIVMQQYSGRQA